MKQLEYYYDKCSQTIFFTAHHKRERIKICKQWLKDRVNWNEVVFTDQKRFNLDGQDNWQSYHRLGKKVLRKKRQCGCGSIMIWGMVLSSGKIFIIKRNGTFNSSKYKALLSQRAVPIIKIQLGDDFLL